jgi:hypothetical protein
VSTSSPIELAFGQVTKSDSLIVQLFKPHDNPEMILIIWPLKPPAVAPAKFQAGSPWWPTISCRPIDLGDHHGDWEVDGSRKAGVVQGTYLDLAVNAVLAYAI